MFQVLRRLNVGIHTIPICLVSYIVAEHIIAEQLFATTTAMSAGKRCITGRSRRRQKRRHTTNSCARREQTTALLHRRRANSDGRRRLMVFFPTECCCTKFARRKQRSDLTVRNENRSAFTRSTAARRFKSAVNGSIPPTPSTASSR